MKRTVTFDPLCLFESSPPYTKLIPERRLLVAILERGMKDAAGMFDVETEKPGPEQSAALLWVLSEDYDPMSFRWVCCHLDLDYQWIKGGFLRLAHEFRVQNRKHLFEHRRRACSS